MKILALNSGGKDSALGIAKLRKEHEVVSLFIEFPLPNREATKIAAEKIADGLKHLVHTENLLPAEINESKSIDNIRGIILALGVSYAERFGCEAVYGFHTGLPFNKADHYNIAFESHAKKPQIVFPFWDLKTHKEVSEKTGIEIPSFAHSCRESIPCGKCDKCKEV